MPAPVKRNYRSPSREAQATATRSAIRRAATELFVSGGYSGTSMREVAKRAGVAERTLYTVFPNKPALFRHCLGVAVVGDEVEVAVADRDVVRDMLKEPDPKGVLDAMVAINVDLLDRAGPLIMVSIEAADADADMRTESIAGAKATYENCARVARHLAELGALKSGLRPAAAADLIFGVASPFTHHLLRRQRRWSSARYRTWLRATLGEQLLKDA